MTKIELDEVELYSIAESPRSGGWAQTGLGSLGMKLGYSGTGEVVAKLLAYLNENGLLVVKVQNKQSGLFESIASFTVDYLCLYAPSLRLELTIPGRLRYQQLKARQEWEQEWRTAEGATRK